MRRPMAIIINSSRAAHATRDSKHENPRAIHSIQGRGPGPVLRHLSVHLRRSAVLFSSYPEPACPGRWLLSGIFWSPNEVCSSVRQPTRHPPAQSVGCPASVSGVSVHLRRLQGCSKNRVSKVYIFCQAMSLGIKVQEAIRMAEEALGDEFPPETTCHWCVGMRFRKKRALLVDFIIDPRERLVARTTWTSKSRLQELKDESENYFKLRISKFTYSQGLQSPGRHVRSRQVPDPRSKLPGSGENTSHEAPHQVTHGTSHPQGKHQQCRRPSLRRRQALKSGFVGAGSRGDV
ncbi:hypothetical protein MTO96_001570 [Rhipicephalus appendiculatus]